MKTTPTRKAVKLLVGSEYEYLEKAPRAHKDYPTYAGKHHWLARVIFCTLIIMAVLLVAAYAHAAIPQDKAVLAVMGEGEGETFQGKLALSYALINRGHLKGVYALDNIVYKGGNYYKRVSLKSKYYKRTGLRLRLIPKTAYIDALKAYNQAMSNPSKDITHGADHWEGTAFKIPSWAKNMTHTVTIGNQRFYR